jgi:hypothetical protein
MINIVFLGALLHFGFFECLDMCAAQWMDCFMSCDFGDRKCQTKCFVQAARCDRMCDFLFPEEDGELNEKMSCLR